LVLQVGWDALATTVVWHAGVCNPMLSQRGAWQPTYFKALHFNPLKRNNEHINIALRFSTNKKGI
jgi:hypothetical protein